MGRIKKHGMWVKRNIKKVFWISKRKLRLPYLLKGGGGAGGGRHNSDIYSQISEGDSKFLINSEPTNC